MEREVTAIDGRDRDSLRGLVRLALLVSSLHGALVEIASVIATLEGDKRSGYG